MWHIIGMAVVVGALHPLPAACGGKFLCLCNLMILEGTGIDTAVILRLR